MIHAGIIGGAGYTGGELVRILLNHPQCKIVFVNSQSQAGKKISDVHQDLLGETDLAFSAELQNDIDVLFLCLAHGDSKKFLLKNDIPDKIKIIDLSQDFRISNHDNQREFVYGLPEAYKDQIVKAQNIANPGCFATAIQLALLPLASKKMLNKSVHVSGVTGSTGAGQQPSETTHFSWRHSNISLYKAFEHQHLAEIRKTLSFINSKELSEVFFLPFRGGFSRGILISAYTELEISIEQAVNLYSEYYSTHPFIFISGSSPNVKQVINTNKAVLFIEKHGKILNVVCAIDNLVKGASGQAVQNMNLMFSLDETCGLNLKPVAY